MIVPFENLGGNMRPGAAGVVDGGDGDDGGDDGETRVAHEDAFLAYACVAYGGGGVLLHSTKTSVQNSEQ